jgi:hypothetical protein
MPSIQLQGRFYHGPADDGDYGVFTESTLRLGVFAGSHANGCARVGVITRTNDENEETRFVECDADGQLDGRYVYCGASGNTEYYLYEHGKDKESAFLHANGRCFYNGEACSADFPPFVELKAKVLPIKARPTAHSPPSRIRTTHPAPVAPQSAHRPCLALAGARRVPRRRGARLPPPPPTCMARATQPIAAAMHRTSNLDDAPTVGFRVHYACGTIACVVHPSAVTCPLCTGSERLRFAAGCKTRLYTLASHALVNARCRLVPHRALRPHRTAQSVMHVRQAHRGKGISTLSLSGP